MLITCDEGRSLIQTDIYVTLPLHSLLCHENRSLLTLKHINVICLNKISTDVYMQISTVVYERDKKVGGGGAGLCDYFYITLYFNF